MVELAKEYGPLLMSAMGQTLILALWGLLFGCLLGIIFGLASVVDNKVSRVISAIYVNLIRGVPMIVLAFFVYYGIPYGLKNIGIPVIFSALQAGTICLALNCGAYMSEIIRAGIQSIDPGQMEAARSLGLSYWRSTAVDPASGYRPLRSVVSRHSHLPKYLPPPHLGKNCR